MKEVTKELISKQKELHNFKNELIAWLNDECPKVFPPLEPYTTADLSHTFADSLRIRLDAIFICRGELSALDKQIEAEGDAESKYPQSNRDFTMTDKIEAEGGKGIDTNTPFFGNSGAVIPTVKGMDAEEAFDEREALVKAFDQIRQSFQGRSWLTEGRGCYPYDDERYKMEVRYILDEFEEINKSLWKQIKSKSFEYRNSIEAPLLKRIAELQQSQPMPSDEEIEKLVNHIWHTSNTDKHKIIVRDWLKNGIKSSST